MGIITNLFHRSNSLLTSPYKSFFLDAEENVHIHYRDLRIEMSVREFQEFVSHFNEQSKKLLETIRNKNFRDGDLPNTNIKNPNITFFEKNNLKRDVKYFPNRISIEKSTNGFHLHIRNYKILLDQKSFSNLLEAMKKVNLTHKSDMDLSDLLDLFQLNEVDHNVASIVIDNEKSISMEVLASSFNKLSALLRGLGFQPGAGNSYSKNNLFVHILVLNKLSNVQPVMVYKYKKEVPRHIKDCNGIEHPNIAKPIIEDNLSKSFELFPFLIPYLRNNKEAISADKYNILRLQILDFFNYLKENKIGDYISTDPGSIMIDPKTWRIVFSLRREMLPTDVTQMYKTLDRCLSRLGFSLFKPKKILYNPGTQERFAKDFRDRILMLARNNRCINRLYVMGSILRKQVGYYEVPFVHMEWAKIGSDIDLLIEIDEKYKQEVPSQWDFKMHCPSNSSDYYHFMDIPLQIKQKISHKHQNVDFKNHLVEGYLYYPSTGKASLKDAFLRQCKAELIYSKLHLEKPNVEEIKKILVDSYGLKIDTIDHHKFPSLNLFYKISTRQGPFILKLYNPRASVPSTNQSMHLNYEMSILEALRSSNFGAVYPLNNSGNKVVTTISGISGVLYPYIEGSKYEHTDSQITSAARTLAKMHLSLVNSAISEKSFNYNFLLRGWVRLFDKYLTTYFAVQDKNSYDYLLSIKENFLIIANKVLMGLNGAVYVDSHGDYTPRNLFFNGDHVRVFDFNFANYGPRLADLTEAAVEFALKEDQLDQDKIRLFIRAYNEEYPLQPEEIEFLQDMLFLQCIIKVMRAVRLRVHDNFEGKFVDDRIKAFINQTKKNLPHII